MRAITLRHCALVALATALCACNESKTPQPDSTIPQKKNADVVLAVIPVMECMPILYAHKAGLFEKAGLRVEVEVYDAQADCDSALLGHADGGYLDGYSHSSQQLGKSLTPVVTLTGGSWGIVASPSMRFKKVTDLKERVVASGRSEASAHCLATALKTSGNLATSQVMMPQVGSFRTRASMVANNQVEAAILPQPYLSAATAKGCKRLYTLSNVSSGVGKLAVKSARCNNERKKLLLNIYAEAVDSLHQHGKRLLPSILTHYAGVPQVVADTMRQPKFVRPKTR